MQVPEQGEKITMNGSGIAVPDRPIIPFIRGDGTGPDIWRATVRVLDAAVEAAYSGKRRLLWMEIYAGEAAFRKFNSWLPDATIDAIREYRVAIKGPLTTPVGGGIRSPECGHPPAARSLRLPAAGALVRGRALSGSRPRSGGHGDLPREHRGHIRGRRIRGRGRGHAALPGAVEGALPGALCAGALPGFFRSGTETRVARRVVSAWCAPPWNMPWRRTAAA